MNYQAQVTRMSADPAKVEHYVIEPIMAVNTVEAARHAAEVTASRLFPNGGAVSFFTQTGDKFLAAVGNYKHQNGHGVNVGVSLSIYVQAKD